MKMFTMAVASLSILAACSGNRAPRDDRSQTLPTAAIGTSVEGTYEELNVKQRRDGVPKYVGRIVIRRDDGISVLLETHEEGIRPPVEIAEFRGKRVIVKGGAAEESCRAWGDGNQATIVGPCIRDIVSISLVNQ